VEQLAIDSYLAIELMVLLIVGRRLKTSQINWQLKANNIIVACTSQAANKGGERVVKEYS
jgi:hypothetical protein